MSSLAGRAADEAGDEGLSPAATFACAVACGAMVANIYFAQPLIGLIAPELGLEAGLAGLIVTFTQLGYGAGLLFLVPLADRLENRRLIVGALAFAALALAATALARTPATFLAAAVTLGFFSAGAQAVIPYAAALTPERRRGQAVGNVMAGLLTGIMLARPFASSVADLLGWRPVFWLAAAGMLLLAGWLARTLPERRRDPDEGYGRMLLSLGRALLTTPPLRRRTAYQGFAFAVFSLFWTAVPLLLVQGFGLDQRGVALFALAGAGGALAAPLAGRLGDRGYVRSGTAVALAAVTLACLLAGWAAALPSLLLLILAALALDAGAQTNQVLGQRVIYSLPSEAHGRMNAAYMTVVFLFGAAGSTLATLTFHYGGWWATALAGALLGLAVLAVFATELRRPAEPG